MRWRERLRQGWDAVLARPGGAAHVSRGIAAGAFAAMIPAFGLHLLLASGAALLVRGSVAAAAASCLLLGNPLTHAVLVPVEYAIGRLLLPRGAEFLPDRGPAWLLAALPAAEEALLGGVLLGAVAAAIAFLLARRSLRHREAGMPGGE